MAGRIEFTHGILLRSIDYGEADRVLTLLTSDFGKVSLLARGARRSRKRFGGVLEPYCVIALGMAAGRGELGRLAEAQLERAFPGILRDLHKILWAGQACELLRDAIAPKEPDRRVFDAAVGLLEALDRAEAGRDDLLLAFQTRLMALLGFAPSLDACAVCGKRAAEGQAAAFDPDRGSVVCRACGGGPFVLSGGTRSRLRASIGRSWAEQSPWGERERHEARAALQAFISRHIGRTR